MNGVRGTTLEWFSSYLSDRYQYVVYDDCKSDYKQIKCGVPQGSILGLLLFFGWWLQPPTIYDETGAAACNIHCYTVIGFW